MNITFNGRIHELKDLREFICKVLGCAPPQHKQRHVWVFHEGQDKPIKEKNMEVTLAKPIRPGFYRECEISTDEAVDKQLDGSFARSEVVQGDSSAPVIRDTSTEKNIQFNVYGDGSLGSKIVNVIVDGHIGDGDVPLVLTINYTVASPDATEFVGFKEGQDLPIPV